jgi:hypothetical protein
MQSIIWFTKLTIVRLSRESDKLPTPRRCCYAFLVTTFRACLACVETKSVTALESVVAIDISRQNEIQRSFDHSYAVKSKLIIG